MNSAQRTKMTAGVGLVAMLLGALIVLVPSGAGAALPDGTIVLDGFGGKVPICHATNSNTNPYILNEPAYQSTGDFTAGHDEHLGPVWNADLKKDGIAWGDIIPPVSVDGETVHFPGLNWTEEGKDYWAACTASEGPSAPVLIVEKDVPGEADDLTEFDFSVEQDETEIGSGSIADGEFFETKLTPGSVDVTETEAAGYSLTGVTCTRDYVDQAGAPVGGEAVQVTRDGTTATLAAVAGDIITCTFTNTPDTLGLTVVKVNDANGDATYNDSEQALSAGSAVGFRVQIQNTGNQDLNLTTLADTWSGLAEPIDLLTLDGLACTRGGEAVVLAEGATLPAGSTTTCDFTLAGYAPAAGGSKTNTVAVGTRQQQSAQDTSTVTTPSGFIPPPPPPPPPPAPASLTLVKVVTGEAPDAWEFTFGIEDADGNELFVLDQADDDEVFELAAGAYEVTEYEVSDDGAILTDVECLDADDDVTGVVAGGVVSLDLAAGADVTCTFTNDFAEVLPEEVVPSTTTTTVAPTTTTTPPTTAAVLGAQVTRLPTTGSGTQNLAGFGAALLGLGAALVVSSNRRVLKRS